MSIRPVDVSVMVQRMAEVDRVQQVQDQRAAVAQQQFGQAMQAGLERRETEVKAPPEPVKLAVNPDAKRERQGRPPEEERPQEGAEEGPAGEERLPERTPAGPGHKLDLRL